MGRFYGEIGYAETIEGAPGVWTEVITTKRNYNGDVVRNTAKIRDGEGLNSNVNLDNRLSIVADPFAYANFTAMRYIEWMKVKWKITSVEVARPRLILTIGEVFNEQQTSGTP